MSNHMRALLVGTIVASLGIAQADAADQAVPINISNGLVDWTNLDEQGDGILGWTDASSGPIGGGGDHFDDAMGIRVGGNAYGQGDGMLDVTGSTITADTLSLAGLNVAVQFRPAASNPVMRQFIMLENPTGAPINTTLSWINNTGNDSNQGVRFSASGDMLFDTTDTTLVTSDDAAPGATDTEANVWAIFGAGAGTTPDSVSLDDGEAGFGGAGNEGVRANFNISVPANATAYMLFFVGSPEGNDEAITLANQFQTMDAALFQDLLAGLSQMQLDMVLNWAGLLASSGFADVGANANQAATGAALDNAFGMGMGGGLQGTLSGLSTAGQQQVLQNLVPQTRLGLTDARVVAQHQHNALVSGRLHRGRQNFVRAQQADDGMPAAALVSLDSSHAANALADTSPEAGSRNLSFWIQTSHFFGDVNSDDNASGYRWRTHGGAMGLDRRISDHVIVGGSIFANFTDLDGRDGSGDADATTLGINAYGSYFRDAWHIDAGLGYSLGLNETDRPTGVGTTARGDYDSHAFNAWVLGGYAFTPFDDKDWELEPQLGLDYTLIHDDSYTETGAGPLNVSVDQETTHSLRSLLGVQLSKVFVTNGIGTFRASVAAGWRHEFLDNETNTSASVMGASFSVSGVERSRDSAELAVRADWRVADDMMIYAEYAPEFADDWQDHSVTLGLRKRF